MSSELNPVPETPRAALRRVLGQNDCVVPASLFDPLSARVAERLGFAVGMLGGSLASQAMIAAPDNMTLTLTELVDLCTRMCMRLRLPVLVDADHGFGGVLNVRRTVQGLEMAGVAGMTIEDTMLPQPYPGNGPGSLISVDEGRAKMRAALEARQDPNLLVVGRTSAFAIASRDEGLVRAESYQDEGVDALFLVGLTHLAELEAVARIARVPIILANVGPELDSPGLLAQYGVRMLIGRHLTLASAVRAVAECMLAQRLGAVPSLPPLPLPSLEDLLLNA